jgi:hypothetical protein
MALAKKVVILFLATALLAATAVRPRPAQALDAWAWVAIGVGSYAVFVLTMTALIFGGSSAPLTEAGLPPLESAEEPGTIRFGTDCRGTGLDRPIACW